MKQMKVNAYTMVGLLTLVILILVFMPLAVIWALNTLFGLGIAYGFYEWLAVLVMSIFLQSKYQRQGDK